MFRGWVLCVLALAMAAPAAADDQPSALQKAANIAKPSVVKVLGIQVVTFRLGRNEVRELLGGTGSGFFISADGYVVTNAHVVEDIQLGEAVAKQKAFDQLAIKLQKQFANELAKMTDDQKRDLVRELQQSARVDSIARIVLPDGTKLDYTIKQYGKPGQSDDVAVIKVDIKDAPNLTFADMDKVQVQDKLLAIGYPGAADLQGMLDDKSALEASINDGSVTALKHAQNGDLLIQINAAITHGNSGGPSINEKGEVLGLDTFGARGQEGGELQGFNFLVAASTVQRFVQKAKVDMTPSKTITLWRKALDEYYAGDLDQAIADFEDVATQFPAHSEATRMTKLARQAKKEGKGKKSDSSSGSSSGTGAGGGGTNAAGIVVAIILVVGILGTVVFFVMRSKKGPAKPVVAGAPGMAPPGMAPPGMVPPGMPPPGMPPPGYAPQQQMMAGRVGPQPVAKTVAIGGQQQHGPVAATAFGSLTMGSLTCTRGLLNGQRFSLGPQGLLIGRQPGLAQIVVNDSRASGKHVWIGFENGALVAIDQGTTNGTFVNDVRHGRISKAPLRDGDTVIVAEPDCLSLQLKLS